MKICKVFALVFNNYNKTEFKILSNKIFPYVFFNSMSAALSGCGIIPKTFLFLLHMPAIFKRDPFGFDFSNILPFSLQYLNKIWSLLVNSFNVFSFAWNLPSPWAIGIFKALDLSKFSVNFVELDSGFK